MYKEISILGTFFDDPARGYYIREIARLTKLNHMTARSYLNRFVKEGLLLRKKSSLYQTYSANASNKQFHNLKLFYNLEQLRKSKLIEELESFYDYPAIVLFGSYAQATNTKESDIDICIITNIHKEFNTEKHKSILKRSISIHQFTENQFTTMKTKNQGLLNNICNGITLSGKLEVV